MLKKILFAISFVFGFNPTEHGSHSYSVAQDQMTLVRICGSEFLMGLACARLPVTGFGRFLIPKSSSLAPLYITLCVLADVGLFTLFNVLIVPSLSSAALALLLVTGISFGVEAITKTIECRANGFKCPLRLDRMLLRQLPSGVGAALCILRMIKHIGASLNIAGTLAIVIIYFGYNLYLYLSKSIFLGKAFFVEFFVAIFYSSLPLIHINPMLKVLLVLVCSILRWVFTYNIVFSNSNNPNGVILDSTGSMFLVSAVNDFMLKMNKLSRRHSDLSHWGDDIFNSNLNRQTLTPLLLYIDLAFAAFDEPKAFNILKNLNSALQTCFNEMVEAANGGNPTIQNADRITHKIQAEIRQAHDALNKDQIRREMHAKLSGLGNAEGMRNLIFARAGDLSFIKDLVRFLVVPNAHRPQRNLAEILQMRENIRHNFPNLDIFYFLSYFR